MKRRMTLLTLVLFIIALPLAATAAEMHGQGKTESMEHKMEHGAGKTTEHMEAMYRLKKKIPEEFRLMDRTPVTPTKQSLAKGKELYLQYCAACHGKEGKGDGPAAAGMNPPPANFLDLDHSSIYGPGEKYWLIGNGSPETGMPGFAAQLTPLDRWHLVNHILNLQRPSGKKK